MKHCPRCQTPYHDALVFCQKDGLPLEPGLPSETLPPTEKLESADATPKTYDTTRFSNDFASGPDQSALRKPFPIIPLAKLRPLSVFGYLMLLGVVGLAIDVHEPPLYAAIPFALAPIAVLAVDILATQSTRFAAAFIARRGWVAIILLGVCVATGLVTTLGPGVIHYREGIGAAFSVITDGFSLTRAPIMIQFFLQGGLVGVVVRVLVWAMFARLLIGRPIEVSRLLLLMAFALLIWLFPLGIRHREYAGIYLLGVGTGFLIHYLVRNKEHRRAQAVRLGRNIIEALHHERLTAVEVDAIRYYARRKWRKLNKLLKSEKQPNTVLTIIRASNFRMRGEYRLALGEVESELEREARKKDLDGYLHLHRALSLADLNRRGEMHQALNTALSCRDDLLTRVTTGLRLAEEISLEDACVEGKASEAKKKALDFGWSAVKSNSAHAELITEIVGRTVPVSWTFMLDAYAYGLLKHGHVRFSRALLTACIYEDPYFSSPYLHLGEWCIADIMRSEHSASSAAQADRERSRRVGRLCLHIAIQLERNVRSLTKRRAEELLETYRHLLYGVAPWRR